MLQSVSKSQFKAKALEFLREVEKQNQSLIITHAGKAVVKVVPYQELDSDEAIRQSLKGSVKFYIDPDEPVGLEDWEVLK